MLYEPDNHSKHPVKWQQLTTTYIAVCVFHDQWLMWANLHELAEVAGSSEEGRVWQVFSTERQEERIELVWVQVVQHGGKNIIAKGKPYLAFPATFRSREVHHGSAGNAGLC